MNFDVLQKVFSEDLMEEGVWHHITIKDDEGDEQPLYADPIEQKFPCEMKVRSIRCKDLDDFLNKQSAKTVSAMRRGKNSNNKQTEAEIIESRIRQFGLTVVAFRNCDSSRLGEEIAITKEDAQKLAADPKYGTFVEQAFAVSRDDSKYGNSHALGEKKGTTEEPAPKK